MTTPRYVLFFLLLISLPGLRASASADALVATTGMIGDVAENVVGDRAKVTTLLGSGIDPHLYKPTRTDIGVLSNAELVLANGLLLEGKMTDALDRLRSAGRSVIAVAERIPRDRLLAPPEFAGHFDPHVWMDPTLWAVVAETIRDAAMERFPAHAATFRSQADDYVRKLADLDRYVSSSMNSIPENARVLVTAHDAFSYFGRRYHLEVVGIQGISTESEAGVKDVERIVAMLVDRKIPAVFVESTVPQKSVEALIEGARARGHHVRIGGELFSDAMGRRGTYEGTYIGMIDHNATLIARALGGSAPAAGFQGKLALTNDHQK
ncbi:MAG: zinc ABC transporter substrate-binding protein [Deltaproteobacteria bacterium]|nr:zinc ABC transporter substrate-binding protein [Deltaproteobacteria bacterium]